MKLKDYLTSKGISVLTFAQKNEINYANVFYWLKGTHKPNKFYQEILRKATQGKVTQADWK